MKKFLSGILTGLLISTTLISFAQPIEVKSYINEGFSFIFNGERKELPPEYKALVYEGRSYVPARFVGENLGAEVTFNSQTKQINFVYNSHQTELEDIIENYENEISKLNERIKELEEDTSTRQDNIRYSTLPITQSLDGFEIRLQNFDFNSFGNVSYLSLNLENTNSAKPYKILPLETKLIIDGVTYSPSSSFLDFSLFNYLNNGDKVNGTIGYTNLPKDLEKMEILFTVGYSDGFTEKTQDVRFYIEND
ncbi:hypothetical protein J2Z35_000921 [Acetoanaerobium pronyense]|uniref:Copper amine oxidase-like N-terminal domain-containing protein n=1 Tax=Acetoanaerobium pronyense TaxID=1482736 RepID=A0ABS4KH87_9FIRM|nr:stalk domain-containing protein [Acetoanaerobium pronyense]MBP2027127.1 hypothetical protein [Acetoanaerobium pronyense]